MRITFLGTGAAGGVPLYGCLCPACTRAMNEPARVRRPCSALVETETTRILLDAGLMNLHSRFAAGNIDAIVLTHYHPDHVQGLFHLRWGVGPSIPVWSPPDEKGCADLYRNPGLLDFRHARKHTPFRIGDLKLTPLPLNHSKLTFGYAIEGPGGERFVYLTDTRGLPQDCIDFLQDWGEFDMALDCSFPPQPSPVNHNDWNMALQCIAQTAPRRTWLTHLGHELDAWLMARQEAMPKNIGVAFDELVVRNMA